MGNNAKGLAQSKTLRVVQGSLEAGSTTGARLCEPLQRLNFPRRHRFNPKILRLTRPLRVTDPRCESGVALCFPPQSRN
jgi:hypothetical protein